jgi:hypothetical protein
VNWHSSSSNSEGSHSAPRQGIKRLTDTFMLLKFFRRKIAVWKTLSIFSNIKRVFIPPNGAIIRNKNAANCTASKFAEQFSFETQESKIETQK